MSVARIQTGINLNRQHEGVTAMKEQQDRIWLCSTVRIGIVGYAQLSAAQQVAIKARLNALSNAIATEVLDDERLVVVTDDGVVLCFLGDPEDALFAVLGLRERLHGERLPGLGPVRVRVGIHLGPIKLVKGREGRLIPASDGLRSAEQVMTYAEPGQILTSRSFFEVNASLTQGYAQLFRHLTPRHDAHTGEVFLYELLAPGPDADTTRIQDSPPRIDSPSTEMIAHTTGWERAELTAAAVALAPYVGPRARALVKAAAERATSVAHLYRLLAESIPSAQDREEFCRAQGIA
jgi:class 3 adenylate cyclase